jgi:hypothetical protein
MEKCPININNGFENILFKLKLLNKNSLTLNQDRERLFYYVCIPIRILIALVFLSLYFKNNFETQKKLSLVTIFITLFTFAHLVSKEFSNSDCTQWWSNKFEIFLSFIAFVLSLYCYFYNKNYCMLSLFILMCISIIAGIIQSLLLKPFN